MPQYPSPFPDKILQPYNSRCLAWVKYLDESTITSCSFQKNAAEPNAVKKRIRDITGQGENLEIKKPEECPS
jgi:hypothetical protein